MMPAVEYWRPFITHKLYIWMYKKFVSGWLQTLNLCFKINIFVFKQKIHNLYQVKVSLVTNNENGSLFCATWISLVLPSRMKRGTDLYFVYWSSHVYDQPLGNSNQRGNQIIMRNVAARYNKFVCPIYENENKYWK